MAGNTTDPDAPNDGMVPARPDASGLTSQLSDSNPPSRDGLKLALAPPAANPVVLPRVRATCGSMTASQSPESKKPAPGRLPSSRSKLRVCISPRATNAFLLSLRRVRGRRPPLPPVLCGDDDGGGPAVCAVSPPS